MNNIWLEPMTSASITRDWFMYGAKPPQKMIVECDGKVHEYELSTPYDLSTATYTGESYEI